MKAKELKVIAEGIQDNKVVIQEGIVKIFDTTKPKQTQVTIFDPENNNDQAMELMVKCGISVPVDSNGEGRYATVWDTDISIHELYDFEFEKPDTAEKEAVMVRRLICKAAYEDLKEKDNV